MKVLASYNIKGGVGKTSTATNLAYLAASGGARTLIWDLDPQGAASYCFRIKAKIKGGGEKLLKGKKEIDKVIKGTDFDRLDLLPADFSYRHFDLMLNDVKHPKERLNKVIESIADEYDYLILDCPPSISLLSEAVFHAADALVIPTLPSALSLRTLKQLIKLHDERKMKNLKLLAFLTMVDRRKKLHNHIADSWAGLGDWSLPACIPYSTEVEQMAERREPIFCFAPRSRAAEAYAELWQEVSQCI